MFSGQCLAAKQFINSVLLFPSIYWFRIVIMMPKYALSERFWNWNAIFEIVYHLMANVWSHITTVVWLFPIIDWFKIGILSSDYALSKMFGSCKANYEQVNV